jgi:hypothetical protein
MTAPIDDEDWAGLRAASLYAPYEGAPTAAEPLSPSPSQGERDRQLDRRAERLARDQRRERLITLQEFDD